MFHLVFKWKRGLSKESKVMLDNVSVFTFSKSILLIGVGARNVMDNAIGGEVLNKWMIFATPIRLHSFDFMA